MRYATNATIPIQARLEDNLKVPITTAAGRVTIRRLSDDKYFNGATFDAAPTLLVMTEISEANSPGWWEFNFNTNGFPDDTYIFTVTDNNSLAANTPQIGESIVGDALTKAIEAAAAGGVGRVVYNAVTSQIKLYKWDDPAAVLFTFNTKDSNGNPSLNQPIFEKVSV